VNATQLIDEVRTAGGTLELTGGRLIARNIPSAMLANLKAAKPAIMALLAANDEPPGLGTHSGHSATKLDMSSRATTIITRSHVAGSDGTSCVFRTNEGALEYARRVGGGDPAGQAFSRACSFEDALQALVGCGWVGVTAENVARVISAGVTDEAMLTSMLEATHD